MVVVVVRRCVGCGLRVVVVRELTVRPSRVCVVVVRLCTGRALPWRVVVVVRRDVCDG